ncbi:hypothetical protein AB0D27_11235 [Streptomyces sp. NPDC048415]|uniref:hypothetical protein n=1 Tax=Streptomyces sp. NPDC048415 TaxID=3154822 RepID=UPI003421A81A
MSDSAHPTLATFLVHRDHDVSGISGTGVVAEGVQFSDGWVVTHWLDQAPMWEPKTDVWHHKGTGPVTKIHGHGGSTRIVWADETKQRAVFGAGIAEIYDVPAAMLGPEVEHEYLRRQIARAIQGVQDGQAAPVEVGDERIVDAVLPIVEQVLAERDRWRDTAGRALALAHRWQDAHGSSNFLVRAAGAELADVLGDAAGEGGELAAAECSAEHHDTGYWRTRQCIRAAQHRGVHIDDRGFQWPDSVATYPIGGGRMRCGRPSASSCTSPDHACNVCGDCMYEHPGEGGCAGVGLHRRTGARTQGNLEELADVVRSVLGIDVRTGPADVNTWLLTACRQLEKSEEAREHLRGQRNEVAQALCEALAAFREEKGFVNGTVLGYRAPHPIHPSNFNRWRAALKGLPANCQKPGGCSDCPHEMGA